VLDDRRLMALGVFAAVWLESMALVDAVLADR
jgi:hypothetical protein